MRYQRGVSLTGLLFWGALVAIVAMLGIKVAPTTIEYYKILKSVKATAANVQQGATVPEIRLAFSKYAEVDHIRDFSPTDLDISKEGGRVVISFAYKKEIPLFHPVSLVIEYSGTSAGN